MQAGKCLIIEAALFMLMLSGGGYADDDGSAGSVSKGDQGVKIEIKRDATNRGTPDETTRSNFKIDLRLQGTIDLLRLDMPFPDEKTDFEGSAFDPHLGDIKTRVGFRLGHIYTAPLSSFFEITYPTACPEELGMGKYQVSAGLRVSILIPLSKKIAESHSLSFTPLIQQVVSVAGDESRKDINYTKFELDLKYIWRNRYWFKFIPKPVIDWEQDAKTGAVGEVEIGWDINRNWTIWIMGGALLWGEGIPTTYNKRVGIRASFFF